MKPIALLVCLFTFIPSVYAHNANVKGYLDKNSKFISSCEQKNYGYHKKKGSNHWHEVKFSDGQWSIIDSKKTYVSDPCLKDLKEEVVFDRCVDGDTAVFIKNDTKEKYRFLAVDTPESVHPTKEIELYSKEASKYTCDLLTNASSISVEYDPNSDKKDKYDRNLVWVWVDGILLQELMVSEGFARVSYIYGNYKYINTLCSLQQKAIDNNKGVWQYGYDIGYCGSITIKSNSKEIESSNVYTVSFKDNDNNTDVIIAEGMTVKEIEPVGKFGNKFVGWYNNDKKFDFNTAIDSNITLEAHYKLDYVYLILLIIIITVTLVQKSKGNRKWKKK